MGSLFHSTLEDAKKPLLVDNILRLVCDYHKLNQKLLADVWSYNKKGWMISKQGINTLYSLQCIEEMFAAIRGR